VPEQIVAEVTATVGVALMFMVRVVVVDDEPLDATKVTVLTPVVVKVKAAFVAVLVAGVAPVVVHVYEVGLPVEVFVNVTDWLTHDDVGPEKDAVGVETDVEVEATFILSK
jgi:hypothetical protein